MSPRELPLHGKKAAGRVALVDDGADYDLASRYRFWVAETRRPNGAVHGPYVQAHVPGSGKRGRNIFLHTLLTGWPLVDHEDGDPLNCTRANMREATDGQNSYNRRKGVRASSRYKGVCRKRDRWQANIKAGAERLYLGTYLSEVAAALAYDAEARRLHGEFARPNFPAFCTDCLTRRTNADSAV